MVSGIGSAEISSMQEMMALMYQKMNAADTDGTAGLSKDELSSMDSFEDVGGSQFLKTLKDKFDALDTDANGELSSEEIFVSKDAMKAGIQESLDANSAKNQNNSPESEESIIDKLKEAFLRNFLQGFEKEDETKKSEEAASLSKSADTDGSKGLSIGELASVKPEEGTKKSEFVEDLVKNFTQYDSNKDGELSQLEIEALSSKQTQNTANVDDKSNLAENIGGTLGSMSSVFVQKLLASYNNGGLSNLTSSLNVAL